MITVPPAAFEVQNWAIAPVAKPQSKTEQLLLVLTGVVSVNLMGQDATTWRRDTLLITPTNIGQALAYASEHYSLGAFPGTTLGTPAFSVDQCAPFAAISSIFSNNARPNESGYAVDAWRLHPPVHPSQPIFNGIEVDVAVVNNTATLYRVSYDITLVGKLVGTVPPSAP